MNLGEDRYYEKYVKVSTGDSRKLRELPLFSTEFEEIKDPPETLFMLISTVNIPDKKINSTALTDERKKEFVWLKHVASFIEFVPGSIWSVHNARRNKVDVVPYFSSNLPLLRQNVTKFGTQKHCTEIVESATTMLNPGQTVVDTSNQPAYALSKRLRKMYPHKFRQRKYFPMFGGLHIEKLLLKFMAN